MKNSVLLLTAFVWSSSCLANDEIQKLLSERAQLESISSELQSEIRANSSERDRVTEKILTVEDEIKDLQRKIKESKVKRAEWLSKTTPQKNVDGVAIDRKEILKSITDYENFIIQGIPWQISQRLDKLKTLKSSVDGTKESLSESVLQWSQFLESERKLATETQHGLHRLNINNKETDAALFRLGLTVLYYKTPQDEAGFYYRKNNRLFHQQISDVGIKNKIIQLVEAQKDKSSDRLLSELVLTPGMTN